MRKRERGRDRGRDRGREREGERESGKVNYSILCGTGDSDKEVPSVCDREIECAIECVIVLCDKVCDSA